MALRQIAIRVDYESFESHTSARPLPDFIYLAAPFVPRVYARERVYPRRNQWHGSEPEAVVELKGHFTGERPANLHCHFTPFVCVRTCVCVHAIRRAFIAEETKFRAPFVFFHSSRFPAQIFRGHRKGFGDTFISHAPFTYFYLWLIYIKAANARIGHALEMISRLRRLKNRF